MALHFFSIVFGTICVVQSSPPPNILLVMMDDLGFTDTSINGGVFKTEALEDLTSDGIKLNYHYANTLCSASRSSLLTGRYAWRTGIVKIVKPLTLQRVNENIPFISNVLKESNANYQTAMYGKFHLGYASEQYLPANRGFDKALFFKSGAIGYTSHQDCTPWFWALKGIQIDPELRTLLMSKFIDGMCSYDLWDENYNKVENGAYSEKLFSHNIINYIDDWTQQKRELEHQNPFFIYYAMQTPHWPFEETPKSYTECKDSDRSLFCNALMYGDEMIAKIVNSLKENGLYENTVILFMSDNGPNTNWGNKGYGQTLPLRGAKGSTFEGGIRTPAIVSGGYVQQNCANAGGVYNGLVHISDWYPMIKHVAGISNDEEVDDNDIDGINLWEGICNNDHEHKRHEIMHFSMVDSNDKEKGYGPSYIRNNEWKMVINASLRGDGNVAYQYWVNFDNEFTTKTPKRIYKNMVSEDNSFKNLYKSTCFDDHIDDDVDFDFEYDEIMLFKISEDKVEACNVAKYHPQVVDRLMKKLFSDDNLGEYAKYQIYKTMPSKQGAISQIESYDCKQKTTYHLSWNEIEKYSDESMVGDKSWNDIFHSYVDTVDNCHIHHRSKTYDDRQASNVFLILLMSTIVSLYVVWRHYLTRLPFGKRQRLSNDATPLLSAPQQNV